jgi:hypothetical protein
MHEPNVGRVIAVRRWTLLTSWNGTRRTHVMCVLCLLLPSVSVSARLAQLVCLDCPSGFSCADPADPPQACSAGTYSYAGFITCLPCPVGSACPDADRQPVLCSVSSARILACYLPRLALMQSCYCCTMQYTCCLLIICCCASPCWCCAAPARAVFTSAAAAAAVVYARWGDTARAV